MGSTFMHVLYFAFLYLKVVKDGGIVPHETCIEEKKFELIKKSCDSEFHKRKSLIELKESLQNMLTDAGISNYSLIICFLSLMYYFSLLGVQKGVPSRASRN